MDFKKKESPHSLSELIHLCLWQVLFTLSISELTELHMCRKLYMIFCLCPQRGPWFAEVAPTVHCLSSLSSRIRSHDFGTLKEMDLEKGAENFQERNNFKDEPGTFNIKL